MVKEERREGRGECAGKNDGRWVDKIWAGMWKMEREREREMKNELREKVSCEKFVGESGWAGI